MKTKIPVKLISFLLVLTTLLTVLPLSVFADSNQAAASGTTEVYIKNIKMAQAKTREEAKGLLEGDGYIFLDKNLNEGTGADGVWLGYTTTTDPAEAIYDIKLMNTKGGYTLTSMEAALESQKSAFAQMAKDLNYLVEEFVAAYKAGSVAAQKAYKALNYFRMVDNEKEPLEENGLGHQLVNGRITIERLTEIILFCDGIILDSIVKIMTMGIQLSTANWLEGLSKLGPYDDEKTYVDDEAELKRRAKQLLAVFQLYAQSYNAMDAVGLFNENNDPAKNMATAEQMKIANVDAARVEIYKIIFGELEKYTYGDETLKSFFISLEKEKNEKALYPLASILTDGEFGALSYGCFMEMVAGANAKASDFAKYDEELAKVTKDTETIYIYEGVNHALLKDNTVVGFTDAASRHMAMTGEYQFYEKENWGEAVFEDGRYAALGIELAGLGLMIGAKSTLGFMSLAGVLASATAKGATGILAGVAKVCAFIGGGTFQLIILAAAAAVVIVTFLIHVCYDDLNNTVDWSKNPIPEYIYDVKEVVFSSSSANDGISTEHMKRTSYVFYEVVRSLANSPVDLNARSQGSSQWIAMYVSYDRPGDDSKPIKANDIMVKTGDGETPNGYSPASRFGEVRAYNLNQWDGTNTVNGIYMFYKQDNTVNVKSDRTYYIYDITLQTGESDAHCISLLEAAGFTPLNVNLSPNHYKNEKHVSSSPVPSFDITQKVYTYLGYQLTENPSEAITDIRIEYGAGPTTKQYGCITYASSGTSAGVTLYTTKYDEAGTPILAGGLICVNDRDDAPAGFEPVNLMSGGPAVSFNTSTLGIRPDMESYYLYFLPETTFTKGNAYLGGLDYYYCTDDSYGRLGYANGENDKGISAVKDFLKEKTGVEYSYNTHDDMKRAMNDYMFLSLGYHTTTSEAPDYSNSILYYMTYNPYRAIYDIKGTGLREISDNFVFDSVGYDAWNTIFWNGDFRAHLGFTWVDLELCYNGYGAANPLNMSSNLCLAGNPVNDNFYNPESGKMSTVQPILLSDIIVLKNSDDTSAVSSSKSAYKAVSDTFSNSADPIALKQEGASDAFNVYIPKETESKPYISAITATDRLTLYRSVGGADAGIKRSQITDGMLISQLARQGATHFVDLSADFYNNLYWMNEANVFYHNGEDLSPLNTIKFGYSRTADEAQALRDVFIYFNGFSTDKPPYEIYRGKVAYKMICEIPFNLTGYDGAPGFGIYLYGTTDSRAGEPIVDLAFSNNPFNDSYETVRTQNGRSVWSEITDYAKKQGNSHFMGGGKTLFQELFEYFVLKQSSGSRDGRNPKIYFFIHIRREGYDLREQKPYISQLYLPQETMLEDSYITFRNDMKNIILNHLFDQGADGFVDCDLNGGLYGTPPHFYLGYKRTADPSEAITSIRGMHRQSDKNLQKTIYVKDVRYDLVAPLDLNKNTGGDYIYLYTTKSTDPDIGSPISDIQYTVGSVPTYHVTDSAEVLPVMRWDSWKPSDMNAGLRTPIYLSAVRPFERSMGTYKAPKYGEARKQTRYDPSGSAEGKYIAALYVMDKNTLRQEKLAQGIPSDQCTCDKITDQEVFDRLKAMGATTVIQTPINVTGGDYGKNNHNKVFIGYSRTDDIYLAIKSVILKTDVFSSEEPEEIIEINKTVYDLVAEPAKRVAKLPRAINLIGTQDGQDLSAPKIYLYTSTDGTADPIYDISIDAKPLKEGWVTARSENGIDSYIDLYEEASKHAQLGAKDDSDSYDEEIVYSDQLYKWMDSVADMFDPKSEKVSPFYIHCKRYEGSSIEDTLPYIGQIFIAESSSAHDALTQLIAFEPDGFVDYDMNGGTWFGKNIYMAYKRTASEDDAIKELAVFTEKNPSESKRLIINGESVRFDLVANVDLNSGAGGDWLYLYATTNSAAALPIKSLRVSNEVVNRMVGGVFTEFTIKHANDGGFTDQDPDLNNGASGDYIYLLAKRDVNKSDWPSWMFGGSLFGSGSLRSIFVLAGIAAIVAVFVYNRKKGTDDPDEADAS